MRWNNLGAAAKTVAIFLLLSAFAARETLAQKFLLDPRLTISSDFQMGLRMGREDVWRGIPLDFFLELEGRPYIRNVQVQVSDNVFYQYHEQRYGAGPGFSMALPILHNFGFLSLGSGAEYTFASYRGSNRDAPSHWTEWVETGFKIRYPKYFAGLFYRYQPNREASSQRVAVEMGFRFPSESD